MNVIVVDSQELLVPEQLEYAREKLIRSLAEYRDHILGITVHLGIGDQPGNTICSINVSLDRAGMATVRLAGQSADSVLHQAIFQIEANVAQQLEQFCSAESFEQTVVPVNLTKEI